MFGLACGHIIVRLFLATLNNHKNWQANAVPYAIILKRKSGYSEYYQFDNRHKSFNKEAVEIEKAIKSAKVTD